jgi:periplasmic protein TonB
MTNWATWDRDRAISVAAVAVVHVLLGWALLVGLAPGIARQAEQALTLFAVAPPPPPKPLEKPAPQKKASPKKEGRAAPPNLRSKATPVVAPTPVVPLPVPPPVVAAPKPFEGWQQTQGATERVGPGTGAGGVGDGTGSGGRGDGDGGGGGGRDVELLRDDITDADYPRAALRAGAQGTVYVRFIVGVRGRVTDCQVTRSSGNRDLDLGTCELIKRRLRYRPAVDAQGRPYPQDVTGQQRWDLHRREDSEPID